MSLRRVTFIDYISEKALASSYCRFQGIFRRFRSVDFVGISVLLTEWHIRYLRHATYRPPGIVYWKRRQAFYKTTPLLLNRPIRTTVGLAIRIAAGVPCSRTARWISTSPSSNHLLSSTTPHSSIPLIGIMGCHQGPLGAHCPFVDVCVWRIEHDGLPQSQVKPSHADQRGACPVLSPSFMLSHLPRGKLLFVRFHFSRSLLRRKSSLVDRVLCLSFHS